MAKGFSAFKGFNLGLLAFAVLFLGGSAYFMSSGQSVSTKSSASDLIQTQAGMLVKKGSAAFSPCKGVVTDFAITIGKMTCVPLVVNASMTTKLIGKNILATGTYQNSLFYATSLELLTTPVPSSK